MKKGPERRTLLEYKLVSSSRSHMSHPVLFPSRALRDGSWGAGYFHTHPLSQSLLLPMGHFSAPLEVEVPARKLWPPSAGLTPAPSLLCPLLSHSSQLPTLLSWLCPLCPLHLTNEAMSTRCGLCTPAGWLRASLNIPTRIH